MRRRKILFPRVIRRPVTDRMPGVALPGMAFSKQKKPLTRLFLSGQGYLLVFAGPHLALRPNTFFVPLTHLNQMSLFLMQRMLKALGHIRK